MVLDYYSLINDFYCDINGEVTDLDGLNKALEEAFDRNHLFYGFNRSNGLANRLKKGTRNVHAKMATIYSAAKTDVPDIAAQEKVNSAHFQAYLYDANGADPSEEDWEFLLGSRQKPLDARTTPKGNISRGSTNPASLPMGSISQEGLKRSGRNIIAKKKKQQEEEELLRQLAEQKAYDDANCAADGAANDSATTIRQQQLELDRWADVRTPRKEQNPVASDIDIAFEPQPKPTRKKRGAPAKKTVQSASSASIPLCNDSGHTTNLFDQSTGERTLSTITSSSIIDGGTKWPTSAERNFTPTMQLSSTSTEAIVFGATGLVADYVKLNNRINLAQHEVMKVKADIDNTDQVIKLIN